MEAALPLAEGFSRIAEQKIIGAAYSALTGVVMFSFENEVTVYVTIQNGDLHVDVMAHTLQ